MALTCRTLIGVALPALLVCPMIPSHAVAQEVEIATAVSALEGPTVDRDGNVYFSEMVSQRIMKLSKRACSRRIENTAMRPMACSSILKDDSSRVKGRSPAGRA